MYRLSVVAVLVAIGVLWGAAPAHATSVTGLTVDNSAPSRAAGARTVYKIGFTTTTAVSAPGSIMLGLPSGTDVSGYNGSAVVDATSGTSVGSCGGANGQLVVTCGLSTGQSIPAGHAVTVTLNGVGNTTVAGAAPTLSVTTTTDTTAASAPVTIVAAHPITGVSVNHTSPTTAAGGRTVYVIGFTTSSTGGLSRAANSAITLTFPTGTAFGGYNGSSIDVGGTSVGNCGGASGLTISCGLFSGQSIAPGAAVSITLNGITNPGAGSPSVSASTTSDPSTVPSTPFTVAAANPVTGVTVDNTSPTTAAGGQTIYSIKFTASATGGLSRAANSAITLTFPTGTTFGGYNGSTIDVGGTSVGNCGGASGLTISCGLFAGQSIAPGAAVTITLNGITNPGVGSPSVTVSTTSDPATVPSAAFTVVAANPVSGVLVHNASPTAAAGGRTVYAIDFKTSATGALSRAANSAITLTFPAGTTFGGYNGSTIDVGGTSVGNCGGASGLTISCGLFSGQSIAPSTTATITLNGVTNPGAGSPTVSVSTTSDPTTVASSPFAVVAANPVSGVLVHNASPTAAAGGRTVYAIDFKTSATGALSRAANSAITLTFPAGTTFGGYNGSTIDVGGTSVGNCGGASGLTISCGLFSGQTIAPSTTATITLNGVTNPGAGSPSVQVSTSSDAAAVNSAPFSVVAANPITGLAVGVASTAPGATSGYTVTFATSTTGALARAANSAINLVFPAGTTFAAYNGSNVSVAGASVGNCGGAVTQTRTISCGLFTGQSIPAGQAVVVTLNGITNPAAAGPYTLTAFTTSDPGPVASSPYATQGPPPATVTGGPSGVTGNASPAFTFASTDPAATFQCRLDGPGGPGAFVPCVSPRVYTGLAPGQYTFFVRSVDAAGNPSATPASRSFTVAAASQATPTPTPTPTATPTPTPTPVPGKSVVAQAVKGTVKVRLPATSTFVDLDGTQGVPVGATVDTRHGTIRLTALQKPGGKTETATFFAGLFKLTQTRKTTDLTLNEPLAPCARRGRVASAAKKKPKTRRLWGSGHGSFRTRGTYSAATVRGTKWLVQDSCAGTLTRVAQGVVSVRDNVRRKTIVLRAGKHYLARPRR